MRGNTAVVVASLSGVALLVAGIASWALSPPACLGFDADDDQPLYFHNRSKPHGAPPLDPGKYRIRLSGACYSVECDLDLPEHGQQSGAWWDDQRTNCRGDAVGITIRSYDFVGLEVPSALERIHVRVDFNGASIFDAPVTAKSSCTEGGLCVFF